MHQPLAKTTPPSLISVVPRARVFDKLTTSFQFPITWITSPAGSGKTTLVSSFLQKQSITPIWYQVDRGDQDIASFFSYLLHALKQYLDGEIDLGPPFTAEYRADAELYTRKFFRKFFQMVPSESVLVFDNFQEVHQKSQFHEILKFGLSEIPSGIRVVIISREPPPPEFSRLLGATKLNRLDWNDLQLDQNEAIDICKSRTQQVTHQDAFQTLYKQSQGWVSGLILLLEHSEPTETIASPVNAGNLDTVFNYFASEILSKLDGEVRSFLLKASLFPTIKATAAEKLSDNKNAQKILDDLVNRTYFTTKRMGENASYEFHPLFRQFLLKQSKAEFDSQTFSRLSITASNLLAQEGHIDDAISVLQEARCWPEMIALILEHAESYYRSGRVVLLNNWLSAIPVLEVDKNPYLQYWMAIMEVAINPESTRQKLEKVYETFKSKQDRSGLIITFCSIVDTYIYQRAEMISLDRWITESRNLIPLIKSLNDPILSVRFDCAMFLALIYRQPDHDDIEYWEQQVQKIVLSAMEPSLRMYIGNHLILYYMWWLSDKPRTEIIVKALQPALESKNLSPLTRITWQMIEAGYHWMVTGSGKSAESAELGLRYGEEHGIHLLDVYILTHVVFANLSLRDLGTAEKYLDRMTPLIEFDRHMDASWYFFLTAWLHIAKNDLDTAFQYANLATEHGEKSGRPFMIANAYIVQGVLLFRRGEKALGKSLVQEGHDIGEGMSSNTIMYLANFAMSEFEIMENAYSENYQQLRRSIALGQKVGELSVTWFSPTTLQKYYYLAFTENIEKEYCRERILKASLTPPATLPKIIDWPYPVKIYTLPAFSLVINGEPYLSKGRAQTKVLDLLKCIISLGGVDVNAGTLCEHLWPQAEGDSAYQSLKMAIKRLRNILGSYEALTVTEGKCSLNKDKVWIDIWALERALHENSLEDVDYVLQLYQGVFFESEPDNGYFIPTRERIRRKFIQYANRVAAEHFSLKKYSEAEAIYEHVLELHPTSEDIYESLFAYYVHRGHNMKAVSIYRQYRALFASTPNLTPNPTIEALYRKIAKNDAN